MYFTDDSLLPENQNRLIITRPLEARPGFGAIPRTLPSVGTTWSKRRWIALTPAPAFCMSMCATRRPAKLSKKMSDFNYIIERLRKAVAKMVLQSRRRVTGRIGPTRDCRNSRSQVVRHAITVAWFRADPRTFCGASAGRWITDLTGSYTAEFEMCGLIPVRRSVVGRDPIMAEAHSSISCV